MFAYLAGWRSSQLLLRAVLRVRLAHTALRLSQLLTTTHSTIATSTSTSVRRKTLAVPLTFGAARQSSGTASTLHITFPLLRACGFRRRHHLS